MSRRGKDLGYVPPVPEEEDEYSLEAILAEYGRGGRQPAQTVEDTPAMTEENTIEPQAEEAPLMAPPAEPERPEAPAPEPPEEKPEPTLPPEYESAAPDRVALKDIMSQTVDAVLEDEEDGVIAQPQPLSERLGGLLRRFRREKSGEKRRPALQDTEQLFDQPEEPEPEPEPLEPEPPLEDVLRQEKRSAKKRRRGLLLALVPTALLLAAAVLQEWERLPSVWLDEAPLRCAVLGGLLALVCLLCMPVWQEMVTLLKKGRVGCELCAAITVASQFLCCVCGAVTGSTLATPYCAAGALLVVCCQWGLYLEAKTRWEGCHLLSLGGGQVPHVVSVTEYGACRQLGGDEGYLRLLYKPDPARLWQNYVLPLLLSAAVVLSGVVCLSGQRMDDFPWVLTALLTVSMGAAVPLTAALPLRYLSRRLYRGGCAAAGYAGARAVSRAQRLILTDDDLFPSGTVSLNGYKVFGEERSRAVSYAASVAKAAGSSVTPLLERQLTAEGGVHLPVQELRFCEEGGVEATVRGETVLLGSAYFMKKRKVSLPRDMKLSTGLFLAVDGSLTAVFAIKYQPSRNAEWALRTLKRCKVTPVLAARSGNVTPGLLKRKFGVDAKPVYPDVSTRLALAELAQQRGEQPYVLLCREGLMPLVESVAGSRRAVRAVRWATVLTYFGALAGGALAYYLTASSSFALLTPLAVVVYQLLWLLPTLLLAGLVKHY